MSIVTTGWMSEVKPALGMVHLRPLPGSPRCEESIREITDAALHDADALISNGMDGLILENFGDAPFYPDQVPPVTVAAMTFVATQIRRQYDVPMGINVLRNDGVAALSIAAAVNANFVRVNVLCGARLTDQGIIQGQAHRILRERQRIGADDVQVWADVQVKHSAAIAPRSLHDETLDTLHRGLADALIVSGSSTAQQASPNDLSEVKQAAGGPVLVGSGVSARNLHSWIPIADGFIVGSALKINGQPSQPVDPEAVREFVRILKQR